MAPSESCTVPWMELAVAATARAGRVSSSPATRSVRMWRSNVDMNSPRNVRSGTGLLTCASTKGSCLPRAPAPVATCVAPALSAYSYGVVADLHRLPEHPAGKWLWVEIAELSQG